MRQERFVNEGSLLRTVFSWPYRRVGVCDVCRSLLVWSLEQSLELESHNQLVIKPHRAALYADC